jgi:hypothetical protein
MIARKSVEETGIADAQRNKDHKQTHGKETRVGDSGRAIRDLPGPFCS